MRVVFLVCLLAASAEAEPWYRGEHGTNRVVHLTLTTIGLAAYATTGFFEDDVACRWCGEPNDVDRSMREALVWEPSRRESAADASDVATYLLTPSLSIGLVLAGSFPEPTIADVIDDVVPVFETVAVTGLVTRAMKLSFARTRPYAQFTEMQDSDKDHLSFVSAHTSQAFALVTSAAMVARARGYKSEPYIWAAGMTLAVTNAYLRVAADRHYLTDVIAGASLGVAAGLTVPSLMKRDVELVPTRTGIAFARVW